MNRMKKIGILVTVMAMVGFLTAVDSFAQKGMKWKGSGGWGMGSQYNRMFNPNTVETLAGEVVGVEAITPMKGMSYGVHLMLKTEKETLSVHLGPGWFVENQDVKIEAKDKVEVTGSRVTFDGKPAIIAAQVKKGDGTLVLRDGNGFPVWSGWRRP